MKKKFIKLNNNDNHLSLGNVIRYIKNISNNKTLATQTQIFCAIFNVEDANDSTVNNYCIGYRSIGNNYKDIFYNYQKDKKKNSYVLVSNILNVLSIIDGNIYVNEDNKKSLELINNNKKLYNLIIELYNIAKNDNGINNDFINELKTNIDNNNLYNALSMILFYIVLEKIQPIYIDNIVKNAIETLINNTNISINDLENFLNVEFMDGINYTYKIKQMAINNNPYALFALAMMEYRGEITGESRYNVCYEYLKKASISKHPRANFMITYLIYNNKIGNKSTNDLEIAWKHLNTAKDTGSIAALNTMGIAYLNGYCPDGNINVEKAIHLFEKAASYNYTYAYNNLGKIYEDRKEYKKAFEYYLKSANLEESWACNKVGFCYYQGIGVDRDLKKAFEYFNTGCLAPIKNQCCWNKYNLAKYFYLEGCYEANVEKDVSKAIDLLEEIENDLIDSVILLFYIAIANNNKDKIWFYKDKIENHAAYNDNVKKDIEDKLKYIKDNKIDTSLLFD